MSGEIHALSSYVLNSSSRRLDQSGLPDKIAFVQQHGTMTDETQKDWFLREWLRHSGKKQSSLVNELGWLKGRANNVWHSRQKYTRDDVNEISAWLGISPFELLLRPEEAIALRRLRATAEEIAANFRG